MAVTEGTGDTAAKRAIAGLSGSVAFVPTEEPKPKVFMGGSGNMRGTVGLDGPNVRPGRRVLDADQADGEFYGWDDRRRADWGKYLVGLGVLTEDEAGDFNTLQQAWSESVEQSSRFYAAGKRDITPRDAARIMADPGAAAKRVASQMPFTGSKSQTSQSVDLTDPASAKALVNDVLARHLGRAASDEEVRAFTGVLNTAERASPTTTTTTSQFDQGEVTSQASTTSGGLGAAGRQQIMDDRATATPEFGSYQASSTYFNALLSAIQAPV